MKRSYQAASSSSTTVTGKGTMKFNMVSLSPNFGSNVLPGLLVDDNAPYSGLGIVELRSFVPDLLPE